MATKRGQSGNGNDVNVSPISDRGRSASSQAAAGSSGAARGFSYLQQSAQPDPAPLPSTVTRRGVGAHVPAAAPPAAKRTITPRGKRTNPFAGGEVLGPSRRARPQPGVEEIDTDDRPPTVVSNIPLQERAVVPGVARRPIGVRAKQLMHDPFAGSLLDDRSSPPDPGQRAAATAAVDKEKVASPSSPSGRSNSSLGTPADGAARRPTTRRSSSGRRTPTKKSPPIAAGHVSLTSIDAAMTEQQQPLQQLRGNEDPNDNGRSSVPSTNSRDSAGGRAVFQELKGGFSVCLQLTGVAALCTFLCVTAVFYAAPLFATFEDQESELIRNHVQSIVQMQATYRQPAMGLNTSDTRCLYLRVLQDGSEKLDDAIATLPKVGGGLTPHHEDEALRLHQIARAYHMLRHRTRLYARSRDRSIFNHMVVYPFRDAFVYGVVRHGWADTLLSLFWRPTPSDWFHRLVDVGVCMRQMEQLPCPSFELVKEKAMRKLAKQQKAHVGGSDAAVGGDCVSMECLKALTAMLVDSSGRSNQWYNDAYCVEAMKATAKNGALG